jgi:Tol biopolymer transport system component
MDHAPTLTRDELTLVFGSDRSGGQGETDLWMSQRAGTDSTFSSPTNLSELNTSAAEDGPSLSGDGRTLLFMSERTGGSGGQDIWMATRETAESSFSSPTNLTEVNSSSADLDPAISDDGHELFWTSSRGGSYRIWRSWRDCL